MNLNKLRKRCLCSIPEYYSEGKVHDTLTGPYVFKDNGAKILAVAHLDTVQTKPIFKISHDKDGLVIVNPQLDDRLGAHVILDILPEMGITTDVLLTTGEEMGMSTGEEFKPDKEYNWMFSFDRRGEDVVMYEYEEPELNKRLMLSGFKIGIGSFSDISFMEHLGIKGFNVGTGYTGEHSLNCYFRPRVLEHQLARFSRFYSEYKGVKMPHEQSFRAWRYSYPSRSAYFYDEHDWELTEFCDNCGITVDREKIRDWGGYILCEDCFDAVRYEMGDFGIK